MTNWLTEIFKNVVAAPVSAAGAPTSFNENFTGTAARVAIFRKIHFCDPSVTIGERTNALDYFESNVRDVLCPQPL
jgi:hypothetical protein